MYDLSETHRVLADYYDIALPNDFLYGIIDASEDLQDEIAHNAISDTAARDKLIDAVCLKFGISVNEKSIWGQNGAHHWPCYGDSSEYNREFFRQFKEKLVAFGGSTIE